MPIVSGYLRFFRKHGNRLTSGLCDFVNAGWQQNYFFNSAPAKERLKAQLLNCWSAIVVNVPHLARHLPKHDDIVQRLTFYYFALFRHQAIAVHLPQP